jgi:hypothetical protein
MEYGKTFSGAGRDTFHEDRATLDPSRAHISNFLHPVLYFYRQPIQGNHSISTIYNMSGRVVSNIQTRAEGESLYIRYNTDANVVNDLKNDSSYEFIGEVILKINIV